MKPEWNNTYRVTHGAPILALHPQAILAQARTGHVPDGWQVIYGEKKPFAYTRQLFQGWTLRGIGVYFLVSLVFGFLLTLFFFAILDIFTFIAHPSNIGIAILMSFLQNIGGSFFGIYFILLIYALVFDLGSKKPFAVITLGGFVEFDPLEKTNAQISFTELADMRYEKPSKENPFGVVELTFRDGMLGKWTPLTPAAAAVIDAFQMWQVNTARMNLIATLQQRVYARTFAR